MAGANHTLVANLEGTLERLMEELQGLNDSRCEVAGEELELMQEQTVEKIKLFIESLDRTQVGDTEISNKLLKLKAAIRYAIRASFDTEEMLKYFGPQDADDLGTQLIQLEEDFKLKKVASDVYVHRKLNILKELQFRGAMLSEEHKAFLAGMWQD